MIMPGKMTALRDSTLYKMTDIMDAIRRGPVSVTMLYENLNGRFDGVKDYIDALDCLYMLRRIYIDEGGMLHAVHPVDQ